MIFFFFQHFKSVVIIPLYVLFPLWLFFMISKVFETLCFQQFDCVVHWCGFLFMCPIWSLLSFLRLQVNVIIKSGESLTTISLNICLSLVHSFPSGTPISHPLYFLTFNRNMFNRSLRLCSFLLQSMIILFSYCIILYYYFP